MLKLKSPTPVQEVYLLRDIRAVDGDTIEAFVHLEFEILTKQRFRLKGFYAPELDGATPDQGESARKALEVFLSGHTCAVMKRGCRKDNHGRHVGVLLVDGKAADPFLTIYPYQLTPEQHAQDLKFARQQRGKRGASL